MAKIKLTKCNPPKLRKTMGVMKLYFNDNFPGHIKRHQNLKYSSKLSGAS